MRAEDGNRPTMVLVRKTSRSPLPPQGNGSKVAVSQTNINMPNLDAWKFPFDPGGHVQETADVLIKNLNKVVMFDLVLFAYGTKSSAVCFSPCLPITADPPVIVASNGNAWEERERPSFSLTLPPTHRLSTLLILHDSTRHSLLHVDTLLFHARPYGRSLLGRSRPATLRSSLG